MNDNPWSKCLEVASVSDLGMRRTNNQDSHQEVLARTQALWNRRGHLFIVADGMGAHAAGELASKLATDSIPIAYMKKGTLSPAEALPLSLQEANRLIHTKGNADEALRGMGTTCDSLLILPEGVLIAHVGDSRVYRLRNRKLEQMTFDHSVVWELQANGVESAGVQKNMITRCLGVNPEVQVDLEGPTPCMPNDIYLMCSDGLSGQYEEAEGEIGMVLSLLPLQEATQSLVDLANLRGGPDNITVTTIKYLGPQTATGPVAEKYPAPTASHTELEAKPVPTWVWSVLVLFVVLFLLSLPLAIYGHVTGWPLMGVSVLGLAGFGGYLATRRAGAAFAHRFGKGPYRQYDATPNVAFLRKLRDMYTELRTSAIQQGSFEWHEVDQWEANAKKAEEEKKLLDACRNYLRAISGIWRQLNGENEDYSVMVR
ncbi:MAG: protein phosphatase 2C domain-containing protein [Planctomycetia bacterium]|nr:protein phosphatase 2C domain-containing protein [Planctomycetia bacterium]